MKELSVMVCCYNSAERLPKTLEYLANQKVPENVEWEIILVDNNSTDGTKEVAEQYWKEIGPLIEFTVVKEPLPGLSRARRCGVEKSKGKYILYCDDDNWLDKNYLSNAIQIMEKDSWIGVLGGIGSPVFETEKPIWFDPYTISYALGPQGEKNGEITFTKGYVYGAGSIFRRQVLEELFSKDFEHLLSDRKGKKLISGGDNELGYCIAFMGYKIYYSENLKFKHFIPAQRLNLTYLKGLRIGYANSYDVVKSYQTILFSRGKKRRNFYDRRNEYKKYLKEIFLALRKRRVDNIDDAAFTSIFYSRFYIIINGIFNWRSNIENEKKIFDFYNQINKIEN